MAEFLQIPLALIARVAKNISALCQKSSYKNVDTLPSPMSKVSKCRLHSLTCISLQKYTSKDEFLSSLLSHLQSCERTPYLKDSFRSKQENKNYKLEILFLSSHFLCCCKPAMFDGIFSVPGLLINTSG